LSGGVEKVNGSMYQVDLTLWTGYWLVDRTGLGLSFCEDPKVGGIEVVSEEIYYFFSSLWGDA